MCAFVCLYSPISLTISHKVSPCRVKKIWILCCQICNGMHNIYVSLKLFSKMKTAFEKCKVSHIKLILSIALITLFGNLKEVNPGVHTT